MTDGAGATNPMAVHVKVIAIVDLVFGAIAAIGALVVLLAFLTGSGLFAEGGQDGLAGLFAAMGLFLALLVAVFAAMYMLAGTLLLKHRRAGKTWGIIAAVPSLFSFPVGTALAVYAFVILSKPETDRLLTAT